tara:strand:+ start:5235 stop:5501 length:267 start_codon:yes stop_codon:yes gene_type:complete
MIKVKSYKDLNHDFKEFEIPEDKWNLEIRRKINRMVDDCTKGKMVEFDAYCDILIMATKLEEDDIFKLSEHEIQAAGLTIISMMNKKK